RHSTRLGLTVTQALLKGYDVNANLVNIRKSELDVASSEYELRGFIESLVAQVESTYWDYVLSLKQLKILEESLALAEESRRQTAERISIGKLAETELAAAEAEVALRKQDLINAKASLSSIRLRLLRLHTPPASNLWEIQIIAKEEPSIPQVELDDVENHINVALKMRPEMNQAKLQVLKGELDVIKTKDGLLPKLDAFLSLGRSGYADSLWDSIRNFNERNHDFSGGLIFEFPLGNRAAKAQTKRALLSHEQSLLALQNLSQLIEVDIRSAYVEVRRSKEQVTASAATRKLQEEKLRAENEKFNVGKSTAFMVAQAQRDFVRSQVSEVEAVVKYLKALVDLYRLEGSLLERRGISAPGRTPVTLPLETTEEKK
ncbi:MAG: TolC family protein, partial [Planctomycetota bacterium]|nr:TolC family protein [Planctomycetota bacterium]